MDTTIVTGLGLGRCEMHVEFIFSPPCVATFSPFCLLFLSSLLLTVIDLLCFVLLSCVYFCYTIWLILLCV